MDMHTAKGDHSDGSSYCPSPRGTTRKGKKNEKKVLSESKFFPKRIGPTEEGIKCLLKE